MKLIFTIYVCVINFFLLLSIVNAQDSLVTFTNDSINSFNFQKDIINSSTHLSTTSKVFGNFQSSITKNSFSEILEMQSGYIINNLGSTERNPINFNGFNFTNIGIFRDGIQVNDFIYRGFDVENISISEIDSIEDVSTVSSFLYGVNTGGKTINIITKNIIQPTPYAELRYTQSRYNTFSADLYYSQSLNRNFNIQFGLNKSISDGRFINSSFNKWQARTKLNFYINSNFNLKTNIYINKIKRGLFGGLTNELTVNNNQVVDTNANETWDNIYFDITSIVKLFKNKENITAINLVYQNLNHQFENIQTFNSYSINGSKLLANLKQNISIIKTQGLKYNLVLSGRYDLENLNYVRKNTFELYAINKFEYKYLTIDAFIEYSNVKLKYILPIIFYEDNTLKKFYTSGGAEIGFKLINDQKNILLIKGGSNIYSQEYFPDWYFLNYNNIGLEYKTKDLSAELYGYYRNNVYVYNTSLNFTKNSIGVNSTVKYNFSNLALSASFDLFEDNNDRLATFLKMSLFYEKRIFYNIDLEVGFDLKKYNNFTLYAFKMEYNELYIDPRVNIPPFRNQNIFNVDLNLGAKIKNLRINFTLENLFNKFNYDTYLYPYPERGGALGVVSRFTMIWNFLN